MHHGILFDRRLVWKGLENLFPESQAPRSCYPFSHYLSFHTQSLHRIFFLIFKYKSILHSCGFPLQLLVNILLKERYTRRDQEGQLSCLYNNSAPKIFTRNIRPGLPSSKKESGMIIVSLGGECEDYAHSLRRKVLKTRLGC